MIKILPAQQRLALIFFIAPAFAQSTDQLLLQGRDEQRSFQSIIKSPDIKAQAEIQQRSAKAAVVNAPAGSASSPLITSGPGIEREISRHSAANKDVIAATSSQAVERVKEGLPKFESIGTTLRLGEVITISKDGKAAINEIRSLPRISTGEQRQAINRLASLAAAGTPEAIHFMGFLHETGLYNTAKSPSKAYQLYSAAAAKRYAPSAYNMGLIQAYGRLGKADYQSAQALFGEANTMANDTSGRVCGMLSYFAYRNGSLRDSVAASQGCTSALANLARASDASQSLQQRVTWLRDSIATGADDGFAALKKAARPQAKNDPNATFCKYALVAKYFNGTGTQRLRDEASQCLSLVAKDQGSSAALPTQTDQILSGIVGFVPAEIRELQKLREANRFRYSWPVPYLPFTQQEIELFESAYTEQGFK